jgi:hypothetical protein
MSTEKSATSNNPETQVTPSAQAPIQKKGMFGVTTETRSSNLIPIIPTEADPIPVCFLTKVEATTRTVKDEVKHVCVFTFMDKNRKKTHQHTEWTVDAFTDDEDQQKKMNFMNARIKHIYEAFAEFPVNGIGLQADSWEEFFKDVETAFNTNGKEGTPIYTNVAVWLKICVTKSRPKDGFKLPYAPNFIERVITNNGNIVATNLSINPKYETLKVKMDEVGSGSETPTFGGIPGLSAGAPEYPTLS